MSGCSLLARCLHSFISDVKELVAAFCQNASKEKGAENGAAKHNTAGVVADTPAAPSSPLPTPVEPFLPTASQPPWKLSATFEERVEELEHFRKGNGHCRVPLRTPGLGRWVGEMRQVYRNVQKGAQDTVLSDEGIDVLEAMGFEWYVGKPTIPWETRFEELVKYKESHGHCTVPRSYKKDPSFGEWVHMCVTSSFRCAVLRCRFQSDFLSFM